MLNQVRLTTAMLVQQTKRVDRGCYKYDFLPTMGRIARLANVLHQGTVNELVADLFKKLSEGKAPRLNYTLER